MFKCNKCGQCCRNLNKSDLYNDLNRGDGVCRFLKKNLCSIYETRPQLCRIDDCYQLYFKDIYSIEEYYKLNYKACTNLQACKIKGE